MACAAAAAAEAAGDENRIDDEDDEDDDDDADGEKATAGDESWKPASDASSSTNSGERVSGVLLADERNDDGSARGV